MVKTLSQRLGMAILGAGLILGATGCSSLYSPSLKETMTFDNGTTVTLQRNIFGGLTVKGDKKVIDQLEFYDPNFTPLENQNIYNHKHPK